MRLCLRVRFPYTPRFKFHVPRDPLTLSLSVCANNFLTY